MMLIPSSPGFGYQFRRVDLPGKPFIKADCDLVADTFRGTTLNSLGAKVSTIEHILSALVGMGIDNCLIEINQQEIPIIDGSCKGFVNLIELAGITEQDAEKTWYSIDEAILYHNAEKNVRIEAFPDPEYRLSTRIDFKNPRLGIQTATIKNISEFKKEIAPCRTYCFVHELEMLLENNLIKGDVIENAILILDKPVSGEQMRKLAERFNLQNFEVVQGSYLNNLELHFENEIARHKLMDMIGDFSLIGYPIKANIMGSRSGHSNNIEFAKLVKHYIRRKKLVYEMKHFPKHPVRELPVYRRYS